MVPFTMMDAPSRLIRSLRLHGTSHGSIRLLDRVLAKLFGPIGRATTPPDMKMLAAASHAVHHDADALTVTLFPEADIASLNKRFEEIAHGYEERSQDKVLPFPNEISIEKESSRFLYHLVRLSRPDLVVETGVANGWATSIILEALNDNASGRLISIDVSEEAGALVPHDLRTAWELRVLPRRGLPRRLSDALRDLTGVDLFLHDSDHHYRWMKHEFGEMKDRMHPRGWIVSDDIDLNLAFIELCRDLERKPHLLFDTRKVLGVVQKP